MRYFNNDWRYFCRRETTVDPDDYYSPLEKIPDRLFYFRGYDRSTITDRLQAGDRVRTVFGDYGTVVKEYKEQGRFDYELAMDNGEIFVCPRYHLTKVEKEKTENEMAKVTKR
jgi:preprotein translocase subunit YajC